MRHRHRWPGLAQPLYRGCRDGRNSDLRFSRTARNAGRTIGIILEKIAEVGLAVRKSRGCARGGPKRASRRRCHYRESQKSKTDPEEIRSKNGPLALRIAPNAFAEIV